MSSAEDCHKKIKKIYKECLKKNKKTQKDCRNDAKDSKETKEECQKNLKKNNRKCQKDFKKGNKNCHKKIREEDYFSAKKAKNLSDKQKKYCRCILHVASDQPDWCLINKEWEKKKGEETCYQPYAICTKNVGRDSNHCYKYYNLNKLPYNELRALMLLKGKK